MSHALRLKEDEVAQIWNSSRRKRLNGNGIAMSDNDVTEKGSRKHKSIKQKNRHHKNKHSKNRATKDKKRKKKMKKNRRIKHEDHSPFKQLKSPLGENDKENRSHKFDSGDEFCNDGSIPQRRAPSYTPPARRREPSYSLSTTRFSFRSPSRSAVGSNEFSKENVSDDYERKKERGRAKGRGRGTRNEKRNGKHDSDSMGGIGICIYTPKEANGYKSDNENSDGYLSGHSSRYGSPMDSNYKFEYISDDNNNNNTYDNNSGITDDNNFLAPTPRWLSRSRSRRSRSKSKGRGWGDSSVGSNNGTFKYDSMYDDKSGVESSKNEYDKNGNLSEAYEQERVGRRNMVRMEKYRSPRIKYGVV